MELVKAAQRAEAETKLSLIVDEYMDENSLSNMRELCSGHGVALSTLQR